MKKLNPITLLTCCTLVLATLLSTQAEAGVKTFGTRPGNSLSQCNAGVIGYNQQNLPGKWFSNIICTLPNDPTFTVASVDQIFLDFTAGVTAQTPDVTVTFHAHLCTIDFHGAPVRCGADTLLPVVLPKGVTQFFDFGLNGFNGFDETGIAQPEWGYWVVELVGVHTASFSPQGSATIWGIGMSAP